MKTRNILLNTGMLFVLLTGTAVAEPKNGFGLNAGLVNHSRDCGSTCIIPSTSGLSIGLDYQFALSDSWSISPFLMTSGETTNVSGITANHGILGAQLRYWAGDMFFGGHLGSYSEVFTVSAGSLYVSSSASGGGAGLVAGWENPNGGLYVMGQLDSATIDYPNNSVDAKLSAFRLSAGYRWK